tara:strand:- start:408 stop:590 length:183 start_codon:yes stop_codon:yes gene_type:complete
MDSKIILTKKERENILSATKMFAGVVEKLPVELDEKKKFIFDFMTDYTKELIDIRKPIEN